MPLFEEQPSKKPEGRLTSTQYGILQAIWENPGSSATIAEIWHIVAARRSVARTTVLNLVDRLEKRGWLVREGGGKPQHYRTALDRRATATLLAGGFVEDFFEGSAKDLVMSLLGGVSSDSATVESLRSLLDSLASNDNDGSPTKIDEHEEDLG